MSIKLSDKCEQCKKSIKRFHLYKNEVLCGMCYRSRFMIIHPNTFNEPFDQTITCYIALTETQKNVMDERIKFLFPNKTNAKTKYLKMLLLGDLDYWEKKRLEEKED